MVPGASQAGSDNGLQGSVGNSVNVQPEKNQLLCSNTTCVYEGDAVEVRPFAAGIAATVYLVFDRIGLGAAIRPKVQQIRATSRG